MKKITLTAIENLGEIKPGMNLAHIIVSCAKSEGIDLIKGDILVVAQKNVSKSEDRFVDLNSIQISPKAFDLARKSGKPPALCQVILNESASIIKVKAGVIIAETHSGCICANAGIDQSNTGIDDNIVLLLPKDPDKSANDIRLSLKAYTSLDIPVIINDTQGRPFRNGAVGIAIGIAGMDPVFDMVGLKDLYGRPLKTTVEAIADEIASAATLLMGQSNESRPVVIVRGYDYRVSFEGVSKILRNREEDLFR